MNRSMTTSFSKLSFYYELLAKHEVCINLCDAMDQPGILQDRRHHRNHARSTEIDSQRDSSDTDKSDNPDSRYRSRKNRPASSKWSFQNPRQCHLLLHLFHSLNRLPFYAATTDIRYIYLSFDGGWSSNQAAGLRKCFLAIFYIFHGQLFQQMLREYLK